MGKILFKPTCSECGVVLRGDIEYGKSYSIYGIGSIIPYTCPSCGCAFDTISLPRVTDADRFYYNDNIYSDTWGV